MKQIFILAMIIVFLPIVLVALWYVFKTPGILDTEDDVTALKNNSTKGEYA